jgi:cytochrome P450
MSLLMKGTQRRRPPGPRAQYPLQFVVGLARDKVELFSSMARHGDITEIRIATQRVILLTNPDDIKTLLVTNQRNFSKGRGLERTKIFLGEGLLTNEGDSHLRQRRLAQPAFHRERIAGYAAVMATDAEHMATSWRDGAMIDVYEEMMHLTLGIAGKTLFDADIEHEAAAIGEAITLSLKMFNYSVLPLGTLLEYMPIPWVRRLHAARRRMDEIIYGMIDERRASNTDRGDLLSMLIMAQDTEGDGGGMTNRQLRDEVVTLLSAGHETTAVALTWTWYLLSQHPEVEAELHAELDRVLGGRAPTVEDVPNLPYTRMVFAESMRLYPPAWIVERRALDDCEIGGYKIPKDAIVLASPYITHQDARWWSNPKRFDPMRWAPEIQADRPKFSYFPFGAGTRICIGEQFAWMEGVLLLAAIAQHWRMRHDPAHQVILEPQVTLRPRYGMRMQLIQR